MDQYNGYIGRMIDQLSSLPGIGTKSAQRLAYHILSIPIEKVRELADSMVDAKENIRYCKECLTLTDEEICPICAN